MKAYTTPLFLTLIVFLLTSNVHSADFSISCGDSSGYAYYFEGGLVDESNSGFVEDGITGGQISLTLNDNNEADILTLDATGVLKSASSQGGSIHAIKTGDNAVNWIAIYGDGTLEVYSYNGNSNTVASYRNTVGNERIAKNSIFVSSCK
jgi:hypothetical protein